MKGPTRVLSHWSAVLAQYMSASHMRGTFYFSRTHLTFTKQSTTELSQSKMLEAFTT